MRMASESLGTFLLVCFGPGAAVVAQWHPGTIPAGGVAAAFFLVVTLVVFLLGPVSGAHVNPAVTLALGIANRFPRREVVPYATAQLAGATAGAGALALLFPAHFAAAITSPAFDLLTTILIEAVLACFLMLVVLRTAVAPRPGPLGTATAIGSAVGLDALVGGPLTGASMNPARTFGPALMASQWNQHLAYWVGPIAGMLLGSGIHHLLKGSDDVGQ